VILASVTGRIREVKSGADGSVQFFELLISSFHFEFRISIFEFPISSFS